MKIGITCYPTYGGSGVVATELGIELAARGHEIHFISYAMPIRLDRRAASGFSSTKWKSRPIRFSTTRLTRWRWPRRWPKWPKQASLDLLHVHYAIPHSVSALLARMMAAPRRLPFITTLHGTDITLVGSDRSYLPITRFSIEQSDGVTAISNYLRERTLREFEIKRPIEVIPNFVNCDLYKRADESMRCAQAGRPNGEPILMHLSNFRPVKRVTDVVEIFALVREKIPAKLVMIGDGPDRGAAEYMVRKKRLAKDVFFLGKQDRVQEKLGRGRSVSAAERYGIVRAGGARSDGLRGSGGAPNVGGLPEVVTHGVDGYLFAPRDVASGGEICARNSHASRSRPPDGPAGARQRAAQILLQRRDSALRGLLPEGAQRHRLGRSRVVMFLSVGGLVSALSL